jgi:hypothetical protein
MGSILENSPDKSRDKLFEHLANCRFLSCTKKDCPLWRQRYNLSIKKKYAYLMKLSAEEINCILAQYDCRYDKSQFDLTICNL